jgi:hypothetical protein
MDEMVLAICGVWFWMTRRRRIRDYSSAAYTLTLAHAYLLGDFSSRASNRDRGNLLPDQIEALAILQNHAVSTYTWATRFESLRQCCRYVAQELTPIAKPLPAPRPHLVPALARSRSVRVRFALPRAQNLPQLVRFLRNEDSGSLWNRAASLWTLRRQSPSLASVPAEQQQLPLKAA